MKVKVASICPTTEKEMRNGELTHKYGYPQDGPEQAEKLALAMVEHTVPMLARAAGEGAKMACLPEVLPNLGRWGRSVPPEAKHDIWRRLWDHFRQTMSAAAKECGLHIVAGAVEPKDGRFYNAAALFDDGGSLVGTYHKTQLAMGEEKALAWGEGFPVYPTCYGKVGMFICWDIIFPEVTQCLMLNGAEILFQPTYGHGGLQADFQAQARAHDAVCPVVISMWGGNGRIIDSDGTILARGEMVRDWRGAVPDQILYAEVDPQAKRKWLGYDDFRAGLLQERRWELYRMLGR